MSPLMTCSIFGFSLASHYQWVYQGARSAELMSNPNRSWIASIRSYRPLSVSKVKSPYIRQKSWAFQLGVVRRLFGTSPDKARRSRTTTFIYFHLQLANIIKPSSSSKMQSTFVLFLSCAPYILSVNGPYEEIEMGKTSQSPSNAPHLILSPNHKAIELVVRAWLTYIFFLFN
jgi:hypothetical protein